MTSRLSLCCFFLFATFAFGETQEADEADIATLIFAADMQEIDDPATGYYAELDYLVRSIKSKNRFFVFGGGSIGPSAMSAFDRGSHIIDILNSIEPDAMGVTKREFSYFEDELSLRAYESAFPLVTSNVIDTRTGEIISGLEPYVTIDKENIRLGIISLVNQRVIEEYLLTKVKILDPLETVHKLSKILKDEGADLVLLHISYPFEFIENLLKSNIVDLVFLSDTRLSQRFQNEQFSHPSIVLLEGAGSAKVVKINTQDQSISQQTIQLSSLPGVSATNMQLDKYNMRLDRLLDEEIGTWQNNTTTRRASVRSEENAFANFITDALRDATNTDIAFINGGNIRGDREYVSGNIITRKDIATELPFRVQVTVLTLKGEYILEALEQGLAKVENYKGSYPHVSGMTFTYDSEKVPGERVISAKINGTAIELTGTYRVATTDYLSQGGDGLTAFKKGIIERSSESEIPLSDIVIRKIRASQSFTSTVDGRAADLAKQRTE
ncbi:bifunctional metallophosphatase/5'-nucleotidase [Agaribacter flavus]|uniref:Bifunctional metallophosphatase/5'-nucleotidase n=1 Tax=Agaribacter flavus TaxID=1902781 RepID=A0ABV7FPB6_9ALTE